VSCRLPVAGCLVVLLTACARTAAPPPPPPTQPAAPTPVATPAVAPEPLAQTLDEAKALLAANQTTLYEHSLQALASAPDPQTAHRAMAMLALFYIDQQRTSDAIAALQRTADAYPEVAPWIRLRLVELNSDPVANVARIIADSPTSSAATIARIRLPAIDALAGNMVDAENSLREALALPIDSLSEPEFIALAVSLEKAGRSDLANAVRMRLLTENPQGRFTEQMFALVSKASPSPLDALSDADALALSRRLAGTDHYGEALDLLDRIEKRSPAAVSSAEYQSFRLRALFNSRHYDQILKETSNKKLTEPSMVLLRARAAWRANQPKQFLAGVQRVEREHPHSAQAAEGKVLRAKYYTTDEPNPAKAIADLERAIKTLGPGSEGETLWTLGFTQILAGRDNDALKTFERYMREFPDGDFRTNALFWTAKTWDKRGDNERRNAALNEILLSYPYSYYSYRAREILQLPPTAPADIANGNVFPDIDGQVASLNEPRVDSVRELVWLGLTREATAELKAVAAAHPENAGLAFRLADLYSQTGDPFKAINVLQRSFRPFVRHGGTGVPHRFWEILFPLKYWETIQSESGRWQLDPYLIASIIRQESGFEPSTVSNAGAVGVMQIMPLEAPRIAATAGLGPPTRDQLFDPKTNIEIGVAEYQQKLDVMHGTAILAIAAYNAGEEAVGKWLAQTPLDDIDLFVEAIPYSETRLYVKSVTRNRFEYRRIYAGVSSSSLLGFQPSRRGGTCGYIAVSNQPRKQSRQ